MAGQLSHARAAETQRRGVGNQSRSPRLRASAVRDGSGVWLVVAIAAVWLSSAHAQQLLDHVVARVGTTAITRTDVDAAMAFGIVESRPGPDGRDPVKQMIDRRLMLAEVDRFRPLEPAEAPVAELVARMKATAGADAAAVMKRTGVDEKRLTELARETLRLQSYVQQRFGSGARSEQQIDRWLTDLRARGDVAEVSAAPAR